MKKKKLTKEEYFQGLKAATRILTNFIELIEEDYKKVNKNKENERSIEL